MRHFIYELDEFQPWPGLAVYVYGSATISYKWEGRDRDTGYRGGPYDIEVEAVVINGDVEIVDYKELAQASSLFRAIETALIASDHVAAMCIADHEEG